MMTLIILLSLVFQSDNQSGFKCNLNESIRTFIKANGDYNKRLVKIGERNRNELLETLEKDSFNELQVMILIEGYNIQNGVYVGQIELDERVFRFTKSSPIIELFERESLFLDCVMNAIREENYELLEESDPVFDGYSYLVSVIHFEENAPKFIHFNFEDSSYTTNCK